MVFCLTYGHLGYEAGRSSACFPSDSGWSVGRRAARGSPSLQSKRADCPLLHTVILAESQIWLRPWATVKRNSTRHTVGSSSRALTVTLS